MSFCKLSAAQIAGLTAFIGLKEKASKNLKKRMDAGEYGRVYDALDMLSGPLSFAREDFKGAGEMSAGVRAVNMFLFLMDSSPDVTTQNRNDFKDLLDTNCWDKIATGLSEKIADSMLKFTGADLHAAYAPENDNPCIPPQLPNWLVVGVNKVIDIGQAIGSFFADTLPDFFMNTFLPFLKNIGSAVIDGVKDVGKFFSEDMINFFSHDVADFFKNFGEGFLDGVGDIGNWFEGAFD